jgi:hypothetical protein
MGRWSFSNKEEANNLKKVEIWWLKKYGYLDGYKYGGIEWNNSWSGTKSSIGITGSTMDGDKYIQFQYTQTDRDTDKKEEFDYKVNLTATPCNYGGVRYWFICPLYKNGVYCGRRVGTLYKRGDYFGCRHCHDLTYRSKNENRKHKYNPLFASLTLGKKMEDLEDKIKTPYYAGKPTKKQKQLDRLYNCFILNATLLKKIKGL